MAGITKSPWWSPRLGNLENSPHDQVGQIVEDWADIEQCIGIILRTPKGTDPHRPEFASELLPYLDWPIEKATPYLVRESIKAISRWEPRILLQRVGVRRDPIYAHAIIQIHWVLRDNTVSRVTEVAI